MTTPFLTICEPGAVVAVRFVFTSQTAAKRRPAIILTNSNYHTSRADAVMMPLSTKAGGYYGDYPLIDWQAAGLNAATVAKGVIQTIPQSSIERRYGTLSVQDYEAVKSSVRQILGL